MAASYNGLHSIGAAREDWTFNGSSHLPGGACNFRELGRGTKSPVCGCKRFWLNISNPVTQSGVTENAWCFCGHHACFHNAVSQQTQRLASAQPSIAATLTDTVEDCGRNTPEGYVAVQRAGSAISGLGIRPDSRAQSQSINTRIWNALNGFARGQDGGDDDSTRLPSTAASFNGDAVAAPRPMDPPLIIPTVIVPKAGADEFPGSATEVATPSIAGTPDLGAYVAPGTQNQAASTQAVATTSPPQASTTILQTQTPRQMPHEEIVKLIQAHGQRIAALENLSFSYVPVEEVHDKFELFDSRLLDLEQWQSAAEDRESREAEATAQSRSRKRRLLPAETSSFASDESFDMTAAAHAEAAVLATLATNAEIGPRIEHLENRVADLERHALPTYAQPWQIEVVLLPWGRNLRGIWYSADDATQYSMRMSQPDLDEWTATQSQLKTSFRSTSSNGAWTTESIQAWAEDTQDWLSAKACGPAGTIFQRLASRGFVRHISLNSSDARHFIDSISTAFKDVLQDSPLEQSEATSKYHALQNNIIPLRKVRRSTRLRFLNPAEMITPAIWTARFLESSVFMKIGEGQRRLYVTTACAYLQSSDDGLTWPNIRELAQCDSDGQVQAARVDPSIAIEACWSYNDKLDHIPSLHASFASHVSHQSVWSTKSQQSSHAQGSDLGQLTPALSGSRAPRLLHKRADSMPESASGGESANSIPKRRVASFEHSPNVPVIAAPSVEAISGATKRRRLSSSQEAERRGVNFTPRWSREPPSPFHSEHATDIRSQAASSSRNKRGNTPFAYATPHSNTHFLTEIPGDGDTEHDSDAFDDRADEDEWNGMDGVAEKPGEPVQAARASSSDDDSANISLDSEDGLYEEDDDMNE